MQPLWQLAGSHQQTQFHFSQMRQEQVALPQCLAGAARLPAGWQPAGYQQDWYLHDMHTGMGAAGPPTPPANHVYNHGTSHHLSSVEIGFKPQDWASQVKEPVPGHCTRRFDSTAGSLSLAAS